MNNQLIPSKTRRKRRAPKRWREVFRDATELKFYAKRGFGYSNILEIVESKNDISISREGLRVKLDRYRKRGYVNKVSRGRYQIAQTGYYFFGFINDEAKEPKTAVPKTPPSRWSQKALNITETAKTVAD